MDKSIHKHFDFFWCELEAKILDAEAEDLQKTMAWACNYINNRQGSIEREAEQLIDDLHRISAENRAEANRRKANIENIEDPELKEMVMRFYVDRMTLEEISFVMYCDRTTISRKIKNYCIRHLEKG